MPRTITLIRHAETEANAQRRWQGSSNAPLSSRGRDQLQRLAGRFAAHPVGRLVSSDLARTVATAEVLGTPVEDPRWREFHVGAWEGLTSDEVRERHPGELERLFTGEDFAIGGGERMSGFRERVLEAFGELVDDLDDGDEATVVTHGGVIWAIANHVLGFVAGSAPMIPSHNTAVTRVRAFDDGSLQLFVFNDATHLDAVPTQFGPEGALVTLFRHGQTEGNVAGRWQGRSDSVLTDHGMWQLKAVAGMAPPMDALYTSPLGRTMASARIVGEVAGLDPVPHDGLVEMSFGAWENLNAAEAADAHPELFEAIYGRGEDHPRGSDGESFSEAGRRIATTVTSLVGRNGTSALGVVSHGAAIRAYAIHIAGLTFAERNRLPVPRNSSMTRVVYAEGAPLLAAYNVAPHLD